MNWEDTEENMKMFDHLLDLFKTTWTEDCLDDEIAKECGLLKFKKDLMERSKKMDKTWIKDATDRFFLCEYKGGPIGLWGDAKALKDRVLSITEKGKVMPVPKWPFSKFACHDRMCKGCKTRCNKCLLCLINRMQDKGRTPAAKNKRCTSPSYPCMKSHCTSPVAFPEKQKKTQSPVDYGSTSLRYLLNHVFFVPPLLDFALPESTLDCDKQEHLVFLHGFFASLFISANKWGHFQHSVKKMVPSGMKKFCTWILESIRKCENHYGFNHTRWSEAHALYQRQIVDILNIFPQTTVIRPGFNCDCAVSFNSSAALFNPTIGWNTKNVEIPLDGTMYQNSPMELFSCRNGLVQPFVEPLTCDSDNDNDDDNDDDDQTTDNKSTQDEEEVWDINFNKWYLFKSKQHLKRECLSDKEVDFFTTITAKKVEQLERKREGTDKFVLDLVNNIQEFHNAFVCDMHKIADFLIEKPWELCHLKQTT